MGVTFNRSEIVQGGGEGLMSTPLARHSSFTNRVFGVLAVLSVVGMVVSAMTAIVGFEEPSTTLLLASLVLAFAAPMAVLVHLVGTNELTRHEKRIWIRQLAGPRAARALSAYLTSRDRSATAERLAAEALARWQDGRTKEP
jgi:hypothetical protein